jgi:hypothetical protein
LEDLTSSLERIFPETAPPSASERERNTQKQLRRLRGRRFIGRQDLLDRLNLQVFGDGAPLLVTAPAGTGKSTLLATWTALADREFAPLLYLTRTMRNRLGRWWGRDPIATLGSFSRQLAAVVWCGVGGSPQTSSWSGVARYVCEELRHRLSLSLSLSDESAWLSSTFADFLLAAAAKGHVVLILDGLDHLSETEADRAIASLPSSFPETLRLIVSAGSTRISDRLLQKGFAELRLPEWSEEERRVCLRAFREDFGKQFSPAIETQLITSRQNAQPLFLKTSLEELRLGASRLELPNRVAEHLSATNVGELFEQMFSRFERSYDTERPHLVCETLSLLWAARRGLRESELRELLGSSAEPLAARLWAPLVTALRPHLLEREGLIAFDGETMLDAVGRCYLSSKQDRFAASSTLADYFTTEFPSTRALEELPWQLLWSARIDELTALLINSTFLPATWKHDREEVLRLAGAHQVGGVAVADIFTRHLETMRASNEATSAAAALLFALGETKPAGLYAKAAFADAELAGDIGTVRTTGDNACAARASGR